MAGSINYVAYSDALVGLGVPVGPVIASIHEQRDVFRGLLQAAAREAKVSGHHSLRSKASKGKAAT